MDDVHWCGWGIWAFELRSGTGTQIWGASSGAGATSKRCWWGVKVLLVDPVWRVRLEWAAVEESFRETDVPSWEVVGVLEFE